MQVPAREPRGAEFVNSAQKIQALVPALILTLDLLKEGYQSADLAKEQAAMTELKTILVQISNYANQIDGALGKKYQTRVRNFNGDLAQLVKDLKKQSTASITRDFTHLIQDVDAIKQLG
jgi:hypothetical protein